MSFGSAFIETLTGFQETLHQAVLPDAAALTEIDSAGAFRNGENAREPQVRQTK
jgi:hypothetical protein